MKNKFSHNENLYRSALSSDEPGIRPDQAIVERLNYYYSLKQAGHKLHMNSFSGMFVWLFSLKSLGLKASLASVCLGYMLFFGNIKKSPDDFKYSDSCQINTLVVDTNFTFKDTCWQINSKN
jgi:hypothetical protein